MGVIDTLATVVGAIVKPLAPKIADWIFSEFGTKPIEWGAKWSDVAGETHEEDVVCLKLMGRGRIRGNGYSNKHGRYDIEGIQNDERQVSLIYYGRGESFRISGVAFLKPEGRERREGFWSGSTRDGSAKNGSVVWHRIQT